MMKMSILCKVDIPSSVKMSESMLAIVLFFCGIGKEQETAGGVLTSQFGPTDAASSQHTLPGMAHPPKHTREGKSTYSPRELRWLLAKRSTDLKPEEQADLTHWLESSYEARTLHDLLQDFLHMLRERRADHLNGWMKEARESGIRELRSFVAGIERDYDAVRNGLTLEWRKSSC
jgi:hypothetical protein